VFQRLPSGLQELAFLFGLLALGDILRRNGNSGGQRDNLELQPPCDNPWFEERNFLL